MRMKEGRKDGNGGQNKRNEFFFFKWKKRKEGSIGWKNWDMRGGEKQRKRDAGMAEIENYLKTTFKPSILFFSPSFLSSVPLSFQSSCFSCLSTRVKSIFIAPN